MKPEEQLTLGETRVRLQFNPSNKDDVYQIKRIAADFINLLENYRTTAKTPEAQRCISLAQTEIETAAMYGVKAVTY